jgi:hypothetical protein
MQGHSQLSQFAVFEPNQLTNEEVESGSIDAPVAARITQRLEQAFLEKLFSENASDQTLIILPMRR